MTSQKYQLEEYREEFALLKAKMKEMRSELYMLGLSESDPEYIRLKTAILFLGERRTIVRLKINYRVRKKESVRAYKTGRVDRNAIIEGFKKDKEGSDAEIAEIRVEICLERAKAVTGKRRASIISLEEKLKVSIAKKKKISRKICYHRAKLPPSQ